MKPLHELNNVEKGKLLADMLPDEKTDILEAIRRLYNKWKADETTVRETWDNPIISADFWYALAEKVYDTITKQERGLLKSNRRFADNLFDGYNALFTVDCLQKYMEHGNACEALRAAVELLFPGNYNPVQKQTHFKDK